MTSRGYKEPSRSELVVRKRCAELERRCLALEKDSAGAKLIAELDLTNDKLAKKAQACEKELRAYKSKNANLTSKNKELKELANTRKKEIASLRLDVKIAHSYWRELKVALEKIEAKRFLWAECARRLGKELTSAKAEIRKLRCLLNRNPANSSVPPSQDCDHKKVYNSRVKTGKKPGGQPGHEGHPRHKNTPDEFVVIKPPESCPVCGGTLKVYAPTHRQLTELVITTKTTDYAASKCVCAECNSLIPASFPAGVTNEANYGNNVRTVATFLANRCNVSKANTAAFLLEATGGGLALSTGSIQNFLSSFSAKAQEDIDNITSSLNASAVIASDATHVRSGGKKSYIYTYNTPHEALFLASDKRGLTPLNASPLVSFEGTVVHDHDTSYYNYGARHGECNVHVLRYLKGVAENEADVVWAPLMRTLLCEANNAVKAAREKGLSSLPAVDISAFEYRYDAIIVLAQSEYAAMDAIPPKYRPEGIALYTRLKTYRNCHLAFLYDFNIPFDNYASERLLRKAKGKLKQSGGFRSTENGQAHYCTFLSVIETARLRGKEPLDTVRAIFNRNSDALKKQVCLLAFDDP